MNNLCYRFVLCAFLSLCTFAVAMEMPPSPVNVSKAISKTVPVTVEGMGHVTAFQRIEIKSRINGELEKILISDGVMVKKNEQLFEIDTVPYILAVNSAQAELKKAILVSDESIKLANIAAALYKKAVIAKEKLDQQQATAEEATVSVEVAKTNLETAKQNLEYCKINAPIEGMVGRKLLDEGSLISAYQDVIMVISDVNKIKVLFSLSSENLKNIREYQAKGELSVIIYNPQNPDKKLEGRVTYISNEIDPHTGMFDVQGDFMNKDYSFWPGEYVRAVVTLTTRSDAIIIPYRALIKSEGQSEIVYVIKDNVAQPRKVKAGWRIGDDAVILEGIKEGEVICTDGIFKLYPGVKVQIKSQNNIENKG